MALAQPTQFLILTGASGSGKTTIADRVEACADGRIHVLRFDSVGVPSPEEMTVQYGSGEGWQRAMTHQWIKRIQTLLPEGKPVLLEGQMKIAFINEALAKHDVENAQCWLVDCSDAERARRLTGERNQPELATSHMMGWARYLRQEAADQCAHRLDTDSLSCEEAVDRILRHFGLGGAKPQ